MFGVKSLKVWMTFLGWVGPYYRMLRQGSESSHSDRHRYFALRSLAQNGVLHYFQEPHTYKDFVKEFQVVETFPNGTKDTFAQDLIGLMVKYKILLLNENNQYQLNYPDSNDRILNYLMQYSPGKIPEDIPEFIVPTEILGDLNETFQEYMNHTFSRLQGHPHKFTAGVQLFNWDNSLNKSLYKEGRDCALIMGDAYKIRNGRILDVGSGNGYGTADLWGRLHGKGNKIYGVDPSEDLLNIAREKFEFDSHCKDLGYAPPDDESYPKFYHMRAEDLNDPTCCPKEENQWHEFFDLAHLSYVLHWTSDHQEVFNGVARVLKPGGRFCGTQGWLEDVAEWSNVGFRVPEGSLGLPISRRAMMELFEKAGLKPVFFRTRIRHFVAYKPRK
ncbi:MAG: class I SAM-dependent methyltransferase [Promethearchaeota archaeon]